jgi:hypothetical protein
MECLGRIYSNQSDACNDCKQLNKCYLLQRARVEGEQYREHEAEQRQERTLSLLRKKGYAFS